MEMTQFFTDQLEREVAASRRYFVRPLPKLSGWKAPPLCRNRRRRR
jgi:hypothetical protein